MNEKLLTMAKEEGFYLETPNGEEHYAIPMLERFAARVLADSLEEVEALKADAERWTQYAKTGFPTAHYNEFDSARKIKGWQIIIKGKLYSAATANEAADMLIAVRGSEC